MLITLDPTGARPGDQASRKMAARRPLTRLARMPGYPYVVVDRSRTSLCDWDDATIESVAKEAAAEAAALLSREAWQNV